ncbi:glycosyltransferase family 4 protein [Actinomadura rupiterrae]|uniref:glycosyltransferase family 4 protein n=1 Tax=Actinomadura rupiterrae TaxID=559627 RepID=UPI0020A41416|nr:glycosyltransferase family 4 protein [Actinomadura rupiterrae]MCP2335346.1 glycosyltransferase involved in cell wall biosynthesis [Actinomadura rupiterrae]
MKLTYLIYNAFGVGGTVRTVFNQANTMVERGHDVEIATMLRYHEEPPFPLDDRVRVTALVDNRSGSYVDWDRYEGEEDTSWHDRFPAGVSENADKRRRINAMIRFLRGLEGRIVVGTRPTINLVIAEFADEALVRVVQEHAGLSTHKGEWREAIDAAYQGMDAIVCLTEEDRAAYAEAFPGVRVERIPNALHSLDVPRTDFSRHQVVSAGRLDGNKGFDMLIEAFGQVVEAHPDWTLRIHGGGPDENKLRKLILAKHLYNHVFLTGSTNRLDDELAKGSVFAMSSKSEGFGMVLLEAMNCGLPVVSFNCPVGPRELVTDGQDGLLVPERDVDALAAGIIRLIEDEELRRDLSQAALKKAAEYGPDPVTDTWEHLYEALTAAK